MLSTTNVSVNPPIPEAGEIAQWLETAKANPDKLVRLSITFTAPVAEFI